MNGLSIYVADFETTTPKDGETATSTRVWAYGVCEVGNEENFVYGNNISDFMRWCENGDNKEIFFHNLKFDGEFLLHYLETNGYIHSDAKTDRTYNVTISHMSAFYKIEVIFKRNKNRKFRKVVFKDSHKKLPFTVERIGKAFNLGVEKLEVAEDFYTRERSINHQITQEELEYLRNDVVTVSKALHIQFEQGLGKMTVGADAMAYYKALMGGEQKFRYHFPKLPLYIDDDIRDALRGGFTYCDERTQEQDIGVGVVFDVTSLYPSVMRTRLLPFGEPEFFEGKYEYDDMYPLYIMKVTFDFQLKEDKIPCIQIKENLRFEPTEYLKNNVDELGMFDPVTMFITNVEWELFNEHYDITVHNYENGWKFKAAYGLFDEYVDFWVAVKEKATKDENSAIRELSKLMLNSLFGKFGTNPDMTGKYPVLEDGKMKYKMKEQMKVEEIAKNVVYTAMAVFITAYARVQTVSTAQKVYPRFLYADTDSVHLSGKDMPTEFVIGDNLGEWKFEGAFTRARFLRAKTYIEEMPNKKGELELHVTCAGMPKNVKKFVTWDNFRVMKEDMFMPCRDGYFFGKLAPKHVEGGIILVPSPFKIR